MSDYSRNFDLDDDAPRSGRPIEVNDDNIETLIKQNLRYRTRVVADMLKMSQRIVEDYLHKLEYASHFDVCVLRALSENNVLLRISICDSLIKRNENDPFSKRIVIGDEKWILYSNTVRNEPRRQRK